MDSIVALSTDVEGLFSVDVKIVVFLGDTVLVSVDIKVVVVEDVTI